MAETYQEFAARDRGMSERSQIRVRWIMFVSILGFLVIGRFVGILQIPFLYIATICGGYGILNVVFTLHLKNVPQSRTRVLLGAFFDIVILSFLIHLTGGPESLLFLVYFFLILGNGIRYGKEALFFTFLLSVSSYAIILLLYLQSLTRTEFDIEAFMIPQMFKIIILLGISFYVTLITGHLEAKQRSLSSFIEKIQQMEHNQECREIELETNDEVGILVDAFNDIVHMLQRAIEEKERIARNLNELSHNLENTVEMRTLELQQINNELRNANEELKEVDRLKENFMATMSHELRTPLTAIIGYSDLILTGMVGQVGESQREFTEQIKEKAEHLLFIINGILDLFKIRLGKMDVYREEANLNDIIDRSIATIRIEANKKNIELRKEMDRRVAMVYIDKSKIRQVLDNLMSNSIKFTPDGGMITIATKYIEDPPPQIAHVSHFVEVSVTDTGIGIPEDKIEKTFDRFYQVDGSSTREYGGVGLGLSIVKNFIEIHGGSVWATSKPGQGSTFTFRIPVLSASSMLQTNDVDENVDEEEEEEDWDKP